MIIRTCASVQPIRPTLEDGAYRLDWSVYTCLTQVYGGRDMYNLLHKEQLHVSALFIGHLQVDK